MSYLNQAKLTNESGIVVNPVQDETIILLRRLVKIMESQAVVDAQMRQRVVVDAMPTTAVSGSLTTAGSITTLNQIAGVDSRWQIVDWSRQAYNSGIRSNLISS